MRQPTATRSTPSLRCAGASTRALYPLPPRPNRSRTAIPRRYYDALRASPFFDKKVKNMAPGMGTITSHRCTHFHEGPICFGSAAAASTEIWENEHMKIKQWWRRTQRREAANSHAIGAKELEASRRTAARHVAVATNEVGTYRAPRSSSRSDNALVGTHPAGSLVFDSPSAAPSGSASLSSTPRCLLWSPELFAASPATAAAQAALLRSELDRYFAVAPDAAASYAATLRTGVRLVHSDGRANENIGVAHASPQWSHKPRYNDCRIVLTMGDAASSVDGGASTYYGYARLALALCVVHNGEAHDLVLVRWYAEVAQPTSRAEPRAAALYTQLGPLLQFAAKHPGPRWQILPVRAVLDVWKLEQDPRDRSRFFVNQFIGAYSAREDSDARRGGDDAGATLASDGETRGP